MAVGGTADLNTKGCEPADDFSRDVYCVLGIPIDAIDMPSVLSRIETAVVRKMPLFISTPNLNFLVRMQSDQQFRESLLLSDLCSADGMAIVWIARLLGVPIKSRIAGADVFDALKNNRHSRKQLSVFFFGGAEGVAAAACRAVNAENAGLHCSGFLYPGFVSVDEMSGEEIIERINSSHADFLIASLGAQKGQLWLQRNYHRLRIPIRAHLGAVVNFQASTIKRAPAILQKMGFEWLWRIREEPHLWSRYLHDGLVFLSLLFTRALPLAICFWWMRLRYRHRGELLVVKEAQDKEMLIVRLSGPATVRYVDKVIPIFGSAIRTGKRVVIDFTYTNSVDARFLGLLLMLGKSLGTKGTRLSVSGLSPMLRRVIYLNGLEFLMQPEEGA